MHVVRECEGPAHRDISEGRPHHEVEHPGLQLQDVGWREHHPDGGQDEEEDGREEGQEGFVQAAVLQSLTAVSPGKTTEREEFRALCQKTKLLYNKRRTGNGLTSGH